MGHVVRPWRLISSYSWGTCTAALLLTADQWLFNTEVLFFSMMALAGIAMRRAKGCKKLATEVLSSSMMTLLGIATRLVKSSSGLTAVEISQRTGRGSAGRAGCRLRLQ